MPTAEKAKVFLIGFSVGIETAVSIVGLIYLAEQLAH